MKPHWKQQLKDEVAKKRESLGSTSGDFSKKPRLSDIAKHFQAQGKEQADKALVRWLASAGLSPNVTENQEFKEFLKKAKQAGPAYKTPERHLLSIHDGNLGSVLQRCLDETRVDVKLVMLPLFISIRECGMENFRNAAFGMRNGSCFCIRPNAAFPGAFDAEAREGLRLGFL